MSRKLSTFTLLLLISALIGRALTAPVIHRETAHGNTRLDLLFDPEPVKEHSTLMDDYGVRPVPPRAPSSLLRDQSCAEEDELGDAAGLSRTSQDERRNDN